MLHTVHVCGCICSALYDGLYRLRLRLRLHALHTLQSRCCMWKWVSTRTPDCRLMGRLGRLGWPGWAVNRRQMCIYT